MVKDRTGIDETLWQKCAGAPLFAKVSGPRGPLGQMWRRKVNGQRRYQQDPESQEQFDSRVN
jgi:hypothetical protein